jgi:hypothetical protein
LHNHQNRIHLKAVQFVVPMSLSTMTRYDILAEQIESILQNPDGVAAEIKDERIRRRLIEGGRRLAVSLEQPSEILRRIGHSACNPP